MDFAQPGVVVAWLFDRGVGDTMVMDSQARNVRSRHDSSEEEIDVTFINGI
jgi:hypothetical protein